jgi:hypothetical protein
MSSWLCSAHAHCRVKIVVLRGSPAEYLLVRSNGYRGPIYHAETAEEAVSALINNADEAVLLTDALVADHIANKVSIHLALGVLLELKQHLIYRVLNEISLKWLDVREMIFRFDRSRMMK